MVIAALAVKGKTEPSCKVGNRKVLLYCLFALNSPMLLGREFSPRITVYTGRDVPCSNNATLIHKMSAGYCNY